MYTPLQLQCLNSNINIGKNFNIDYFTVKDLCFLWELGFCLLGVSDTFLIYYNEKGVITKCKSSKPIFNFWQYILNQIKSLPVETAASLITTLKASINKRSICCISAFRNSNKEEDLNNNAELFNDLTSMGFTPIQVQGYFVQEDKMDEEESPELSYLVFAPKSMSVKEFRRKMFLLGKKYNQDSILLRDKHKSNAYYLGTNNSSNPGLGKVVKLGSLIPNKVLGYRSIPIKNATLDFSNQFGFKNYEYYSNDVIDYPYRHKKVKGPWKLEEECVYKNVNNPSIYKVVITKNGVTKYHITKNKREAIRVRNIVKNNRTFPVFFKNAYGTK